MNQGRIPLKAVVDTNVLVSGLLKPFGPPGIIVRMIASGDLQIVYDARIIAEYCSVLKRERFGFNPHHIAALMKVISEDGVATVSLPLSNRLPDPDDEPFLEVVLACPGTVLITGNMKHFPDGLCEGADIMSPAEYIEKYGRA